MNLSELKQLLATGPITVEFKKKIEDCEGYAEAMMRGVLTRIVEQHEDVAVLSFDMEKFRDINLAIETPNYYDKSGEPTLTATESGNYEAVSDIYLMVNDDFDEYFTIVSGEVVSLHHEFIESGSDKTYVSWLEGMLLGQRGTPQ